MKTKWDYTLLADAYVKRPDYTAVAIDAFDIIIDEISACLQSLNTSHIQIPYNTNIWVAHLR